MLNKNLYFLPLLFLLSCSSVKHNLLGTTCSYEKDTSLEEYVLYNSSYVLPLYTIRTDEKIACIDDAVVYIQCENQNHYSKYRNKKITIQDILVEPGVGFYIQFPDNWYGYIADINEDLFDNELYVKYIFKKLNFNFSGDVKKLMPYDDYVQWNNLSVITEDPPSTKIIIR